MGTKVRGLLKGLRYISQIFDEEKEPEMQIGLPTDVKHVAHIGWDGGPPDDAPGWMKDFESSGEGQQSDVLKVGEAKENEEVKDSRRGDHPDVPKSTRRHSKEKENLSSPKKERRHTRRHHSKDSENSKYNRDDGSIIGSEISTEEIGKKSRRKKSQRSSRSRGSDSSLLACSSDDESSFEPHSNKENKESSGTSC